MSHTTHPSVVHDRFTTMTRSDKSKPPLPAPLQVRLDPGQRKQIETIARAEQRTLSGEIRWLIDRRIQEKQGK